MESNRDIFSSRGNPYILVRVCFRESMPVCLSNWKLKSFKPEVHVQLLHGKELCRNTTEILVEMGIRTYSHFILYRVSHRLHVLSTNTSWYWIIFPHDADLTSLFVQFVTQRYAASNMLGCCDVAFAPFDRLSELFELSCFTFRSYERPMTSIACRCGDGKKSAQQPQRP